MLGCFNCNPALDGAAGGAGTGSMFDLFPVFGARPDVDDVVLIKVPPATETKVRSAVLSADRSSATAQPPVDKPPFGPPGAAASLLENSTPRRGVLSYSPSFVQNRLGEVAVEPMAIVERCGISRLLACATRARLLCEPTHDFHIAGPRPKRRRRTKANPQPRGWDPQSCGWLGLALTMRHGS